MKPHKCPVCEGRGTVPSGFYDYIKSTPVSCKSCLGTGIVWGIEDSSPYKIPDAPGTITIAPDATIKVTPMSEVCTCLKLAPGEVFIGDIPYCKLHSSSVTVTEPVRYDC